MTGWLAISAKNVPALARLNVLLRHELVVEPIIKVQRSPEAQVLMRDRQGYDNQFRRRELPASGDSEEAFAKIDQQFRCSAMR